MEISVIIPCRNGEPHLAQAIGSALDQRRQPDEVIVVDDGSTDGSLEVARRFEACVPDRVRVLAQPAGGAPLARNLGASVATGDALMFLDADDVLDPDTLEALAGALERRPDAVAVCPWYRLVESSGRWLQRPPSAAPRRPGDDALSAWLNNWYHPPCSVLWSRQAFDRAARWDELSTSNQDGDVMMRALTLGVPLESASYGAGYYRRPSPDGTSLSGARFTRHGILSRLRTIRKVAAWLEERGQLSGYAAPLHDAFTRVATDLCDDEPDLRDLALGHARRHRPSNPSRMGRRSRRMGSLAVGQVRRRARRAAGSVLRPHRSRTPGPEHEIRFGLERAARVLSSGVDLPVDPAPAVTRPLVSVIIPTFNRSELLARAVDTALRQTLDDLEVLVVDDGSTDGTAAMMAANSDPRVRYLRQPINLGTSAARNRGMREARGEFIAFLDSDDEWLPDKLARQVRRFRDVPDHVGLIYGGVENHDGDGYRDTHVPTRRGDVYRDMLVANPIHGTSSVIIRRAVVATAGFFDERMPAIEDYDYWVRVARFFDVEFLPEPVSRYHDPETGGRRSRDTEANLAARESFYRKHRDEMIRAGVAHRFLLISIKRHLGHGDKPGARLLALRVIRREPTCLEAYRRLVGTLIPEAVKPLLGVAGPRTGRPPERVRAAST